MAKIVDTPTLTLLNALRTGAKRPSKLTPAWAVSLATRGLIELDEKSRVAVSPKGHRAVLRAQKALRQIDCDARVRVVFTELTEGGSATTHRPVWNAAGRSEWTRDEVLNSLKALRAEGFARSFKLSTNNFQVFWAQTEPVVEEADGADTAIEGVDEI